MRLGLVRKFWGSRLVFYFVQRRSVSVMRQRRHPLRFLTLGCSLLTFVVLLSGSGPALANEILGTNVGVVTTDAGAVQVPCNLIGYGPLRYPPKARRYKYIGQVIVKFGLDETGSVTDPFVVASEPPGVFERAALSHVKTYKYQPPTLESGAVTHIDEIAIKLVFDPNRR